MDRLGSLGWQIGANVAVTGIAAMVGIAVGSAALFIQIVVTWYAGMIGLISLYIAFAIHLPERGPWASNLAVGLGALGLVGWLWL